MNQKSGSRLLTKRNLLGAVLVAGIALGVYLADFWKGFGGGSTTGVGVTDPAMKSTEGDEPAEVDPSAEVTAQVDPGDLTPAGIPAADVIKVVIADRSYSVRSGKGDVAAQLSQIVSLARGAKGDEDGIRVKIYRKSTSRTSAEVALRTALVEAGITDEQTIWVVNPVDE